MGKSENLAITYMSDLVSVSQVMSDTDKQGMNDHDNYDYYKEFNNDGEDDDNDDDPDKLDPDKQGMNDHDYYDNDGDDDNNGEDPDLHNGTTRVVDTSGLKMCNMKGIIDCYVELANVLGVNRGMISTALYRLDPLLYDINVTALCRYHITVIYSFIILYDINISALCRYHITVIYSFIILYDIKATAFCSYHITLINSFILLYT